MPPTKPAPRSRSTLFLMEQLVVIAVFAICAAVCVQIISVAREMTADAVDTRHALMVAENAAEVFKATGGGESSSDMYIYYDKNWRSTIYRTSAYFILALNAHEGENSVNFADISVRRLADDRHFLTLEVAARQTRGAR